MKRTAIILAVMLFWAVIFATAQSVLLSPTTTQTVAQPSGTSLDVSVLNKLINVSLGSGSDIGVKATNAFASIPDNGTGITVYIPQGSYSFSNPIAIAAKTNSQQKLLCEQGTVLNYTGSGSAVVASGNPVIQNAKVDVENCIIDGSGAASGTNGLEFRGFYGFSIYNVTARNFNTGSGFYFHGAGSGAIYASDSYSNKYGAELEGYNSSDGNTAANAIHWYGGHFGHNSQWGWYDNFSGYTAGGATYDNSIEGTDFAVNGSPGTGSGHIFLEASINTTISNNYLESVNGTENIQLGTSAQATGGIAIVNNRLEVPDNFAAGAVDAQNSNTLTVFGNNSGAACLVNGGPSTSAQVFGNFTAGQNTCGTGQYRLYSSGGFAVPAGQPVELYPGSQASYSLLVPDPSGSFNAFWVDASGSANVHNNLNVQADYWARGTPGFTGSANISGCTLTFVGGIVTGKSGGC